VKTTRRPSTRVQGVVFADGGHARRTEEVVTEEPLQLRAAGPGQPVRDLAVTMRTPGNDFELAVGYLASLGVVREGTDVREVRYCDVAPGETQLYNVVTVATSRPLPEELFGRVAPVGASCGTCGTTSIDQVAVDVAPIADDIEPISARLLVELPDRLLEAQRVFELTGGIHAVGRFRRDGTLLLAREDVGRHNALDKVVGASILSGPAVRPDDVLVLSGRVSFEMVQKAALARIGIVVAVSAPSSLAVQLAEQLAVTVLGFTRDGRTTAYSHPGRVTD
jgi:FdhD protein